MTAPPLPEDVREQLAKLDEAFMTPSERQRFLAEINGWTERPFLRWQRVIPRHRWTRVRLWLVAFWRAYQVELIAALITGFSAALILRWAESL